MAFSTGSPMGIRNEKRDKYYEHYLMHEKRRQDHGLPPLNEQPCEACERGLSRAPLDS